MLRRILSAALAFALAAPPAARAGAFERPAEVKAPLTALPVLPAALPALAANAAAPTPLVAEVPAADPLLSADAAALSGRSSVGGPVGQRPAAQVQNGNVFFDGAAKPGNGPQVYVFSKTFDATAHLGPTARAFHYAREIAWQGGKYALAHHVGGWTAVGLLSLYETPSGLATMAGASLAHLKWRYWRQELRLLKRLAKRPGVRRLRVLSGSAVEYRWLLTTARRTRALVIADADFVPGDPDPVVGRPVPVDPARARLRIEFALGNAKAPVHWTPTLAEVLARKPLPEDVAASWRGFLAGLSAGDGWFKRWISAARLRDARLPISIVGDGGQALDLDDLARGPAALKLFGATRRARARAWLLGLYSRWTGRPRPPARTGRAVPISDAAVTAIGSPGLSGLVRRVLGREIVARP